MKPFSHMDLIAEQLKDEADLIEWVKKQKPDRSRCPHAIKPWYNCEECQKTSTYHFSGNFK